MKFFPLKSVFVTASLLASSLVFGAALPASKSPLFQATSTVTATVKADFTALWQKRDEPAEEGKQSADDDKAFVPGTIVYKDASGKDSASLKIKVRVRGHSSKDDCTFPKLRLEFLDDVSTTIFANAESVKIATHCADVEGNSGGYQRMRNQKEPHREAVLYQILDAVGVISFKARGAVITYVDEGNGNTVTLRDAAFVEAPNEFKKRFDVEEIFVQGSPEAKLAEDDANAKATKKGKPAPTFVYFSDASSTVDPKMDDAANVRAVLAEALLGNVDWDMSIKGQMDFNMPLWNVKAYVRADGTKFVIPFDFDLARLATNPTTSEMNSNITAYIERAKGGFSSDLYTQATTEINNARKTIEGIIDAADFTYPEIGTGKMVDDKDAHKNMKNYLKYFWGQIKN